MRSCLLGARGRANFTSRVKRRRHGFGGWRRLRLDILGVVEWIGSGEWGRLVFFANGEVGRGLRIGDGAVFDTWVIASGGLVPLQGALALVYMLFMLVGVLFGRG